MSNMTKNRFFVFLCGTAAVCVVSTLFGLRNQSANAQTQFVEFVSTESVREYNSQGVQTRTEALTHAVQSD